METVTECCKAYLGTHDNVMVCRKCGQENPHLIDVERTTLDLGLSSGGESLKLKTTRIVITKEEE